MYFTWGVQNINGIAEHNNIWKIQFPLGKTAKQIQRMAILSTWEEENGYKIQTEKLYSCCFLVKKSYPKLHQGHQNSNNLHKIHTDICTWNNHNEAVALCKLYPQF